MIIETVRYRLRLWRLSRDYDRTKKSYRKFAKDCKGLDEKQKLENKEMSDLQWIDEQIDDLITSRFRKVANRLMVPMPDRKNENYWYEGYNTRNYFLTTEGIQEIRKNIRNEKRERREAFMTWLAALTGLIGALTGLAAVLR